MCRPVLFAQDLRPTTIPSMFYLGWHLMKHARKSCDDPVIKFIQETPERVDQAEQQYRSLAEMAMGSADLGRKLLRSVGKGKFCLDPNDLDSGASGSSSSNQDSVILRRWGVLCTS